MVRLVAASMRVKFIGSAQSGAGNFIGGINIEQPPFALPVGTNFNYHYIECMSVRKSVQIFEGMKILYVPYDYSCFTFYPPDFLVLANNNNASLAQLMDICGFGLPASSQCVKITFDRIFEGEPAPFAMQYFETKCSKLSREDCDSMTGDIIKNDLLISKLNHEKEIIDIILNSN